MRLNPSVVRASLMITLALMVTLGFGRAAAQTTQPATEPAPLDWPGTVQALAQTLSGTDLPALQKLLTPSPDIRSFASEKLQAPERLMGATTGSSIICSHAYPGTPRTLASDLAGDFRAAEETVPELARQHMTPPDEIATERANDTAARWIASVFRIDDSDLKPTGVIVLWPAERRSRVEGPARRATFVLVRGEQQGDRFAIRQIVFGDPLETPR